MKCPNCGREIDDDVRFCPECGASLLTGASSDDDAPASGSEPVAAQETLPEMTEFPAYETDDASEDETGAGDETAAEAAAQSDPAAPGIYYENLYTPQSGPEEPPKKKKSSATKIAALIAAIVVVVGVVTVGGYYAYRTQTEAAAETAVPSGMTDTIISCDSPSFTLTNAELNYYYWSQYYYLVSSYGDYLSYLIDTSKPLSEQQYDDTQTWQDYLLSTAIDAAEGNAALCFRANEEGFTLPDEYQQDLDNVLGSFSTYAQNYGFVDSNGNPDIEAYLRDSYGAGATYDTFVTYLTDSYLAAAYSNEIYSSLTFTDDEVSNYYDEYADNYANNGIEKDETYLCNVRHILIKPASDSDADWAAAKAKAEELYQEWQDGGATEDSFAELANANSEDTGSNTNGGLYEDVYPGQMVTAFDDWCFDDSRQAGDTGIVQSDYGYHIMYYVGRGDMTYWYYTALNDLKSETYNNDYLNIEDSYTFNVNNDAVVIATPDDYAKGMEEAAAAEVSGETEDTAEVSGETENAAEVSGEPEDTAAATEAAAETSAQ